MMHLAGEDEYMDKAAQVAIRAALTPNALIEIHTYPGRNHAFARPNGDHYDVTDAAIANTRTLDFFKKHLVSKWVLSEPGLEIYFQDAIFHNQGERFPWLFSSLNLPTTPRF